jgi:dihydrolipoamide dehydrogenase
MRRTRGFFKILITDDGSMRILGMRAVWRACQQRHPGRRAHDEHGHTGSRNWPKLVHPHPSIIEGVQECARMLLNKSIFKSPVFGDKMKCYSWRPTRRK